MRILVTGAGGLVGRALVRRLAPDHRVVALDRHCAAPQGGEAIEGDLTDPDVLSHALRDGTDALVHLATIPGGAVEQDPATGWRVNVAGTAALFAAAANAGNAPRVVFASSIAVFGHPMPAKVDDDTPLRPMMLYGAHKAMMEHWLATLTRRGAVRGLSLRLPGIVARPAHPSGQPSGLKSAFLSEAFHAGRAGRPFVCPVSPAATTWLMSVDRAAANLAYAATGHFTAPEALTLPAIRTTMAALAAEIAHQTGSDPALLRYLPDPAIEDGFGRHPPLQARAAEAAGFHNDGDLAQLTAAALHHLELQTA